MVLPQSAFDFIRSEQGALLREDVIAWAKWHGGGYNIPQGGLETQLDVLFSTFSEFRSLFDYRTLGTPLRGILRERLQRATDLNINVGSIGPRCRIQHGNSTYLFAREVGSDFFIGHLVTVGSHRGTPKIGNNVSIRTGAVVVGPIEIGNDCLITANSVVSKSMPDRCKAYPPQTIFEPK
jgi:serine O-acetyltransferase